MKTNKKFYNKKNKKNLFIKELYSFVYTGQGGSVFESRIKYLTPEDAYMAGKNINNTDPGYSFLGLKAHKEDLMVFKSS